MSVSLTPASLIAIRHGSIVLLDEIVDERLELRARDLHRQVRRHAVDHRDVRLVDLRLLRRRELDLRALGGDLDPLQRDRILRQVLSALLLEFLDDVVDDALVEVLAAQERIAVGRHHFELLLAVDVGDLDDRDVERAAAQVVHGDLAVLRRLLVHAERERGGGRLVDDPLDFETRDTAGVLRRLALRVVEVRGDRDHRFGDRLAEIVLGRLLHLAQDFGRHLLRRDFLAPNFDPGVAVVGLDDLVGHQLDVLLRFLFFEATADQPLDRVQSVLGVGDGLALGRRADQHFAIVGIGDDGRRRPRALAVLDDLRLAAFHDRDAGVRRAQVDPDDFCPFLSSPLIVVFESWRAHSCWIERAVELEGGVNAPLFQRCFPVARAVAPQPVPWRPRSLSRRPRAPAATRDRAIM